MHAMKTVYLIVAIFTAAVSAVFDCRRDMPNLCKNGATCITSGISKGNCSACTGGFEGYDCSVVTANKAHPDCTPNPCKHDGICHKAVGGPLMCLCDEDHMGPTCDDKRYDLTCSFAGDGNMLMSITPDGMPGVESVHVLGKKDEPSCVFSASVGGSPYNLGPLSNTDGTCGATDNSLAGQRKRYVKIQFYPTLSEQDEVVTFTCGPGNVVIQQAAPFTVTALNDVFHTSGADHAPLDEDIDFAATPATFNPDGSINLGTPVTIHVDMSVVGAGKFEDFFVKSCVASDLADITDPSAIVWNFIENGCPHWHLSHEMQSALNKSGDSFQFTYSAFKFEDSTTVYITCDVITCPDAPDCSAVSCDGGLTFTGYGRKKRATGVVDKSLQRSLTINDPFAVVAAKTLQEFKETKACYQTWEVTATVVALAVALLLVMFICIILIVKAILNRKKGATYREDLSETTSTSNFSGLPTIVPNKH